MINKNRDEMIKQLEAQKPKIDLTEYQKQFHEHLYGNVEADKPVNE
jgi:hypothetical protein